MGKSTTAGFFQAEGAAVWDADAAVHRLYAKGGAAVKAIGKLHPSAIVGGAVSRVVLKDWIAVAPEALAKIERIVHPLVAADRQAFIAASPAQIVVLDIPLLFEKGTDQDLDMVVVVSAPNDLQRKRVLARPGMSAVQLKAILDKQMPDAEKRIRADHVIETTDLDTARQAVQKLMRQIMKGLQNA